MFEKMNTNSIKFRVTMAVVGISMLLLCILLVCNIFSARMIRSQVYATYQSILSTYIHGLENNLDDVESFLTSRITDTADLQIIRKHDERWSLATSRQQEELTNAILTYGMADGFFIYEPDHDIWTDATASNYGNAHRLAVRSYISSHIEDDGMFQKLKSWGAAEIQGEYVFFRILKVQGCYVGAWVKASTITEDFNMGEVSHSGYTLLCSPGGELYHNVPQLRALQFDPIAAAGEYQLVEDYMVIAQRSEKMENYLVILVKDASLLEGMGVFNVLMVFLTLCAVAAVGGVVYATYRYLLKPFNKLTRAMQSFQKGNWDIRLPEDTELDEFADVNSTFNHMVEQVEELKIDVYEQKIEKQYIENQMLKQQMAPHTLINCLNTIHGLAGTGKTELVQRMAEDLGRHLRYLLAGNQTIPFRQDLDHARNYIAICTIRYGDGILLEEQVDADVLDAYIPPLLVHSFVENSVKYALSPDRRTIISVRAWREENRLRLQMHDNGPGYSREMLNKLSGPVRISSNSGFQIGLMNLRRRAMLLYGEDKTRVLFSNGPEGGAKMDVTIPYYISEVRSI